MVLMTRAANYKFWWRLVFLIATLAISKAWGAELSPFVPKPISDMSMNRDKPGALVEKIDQAFPAPKMWPSRFANDGTYDKKEIDSEFRNFIASTNKFEIIRRNKNSLHALTKNAFFAVFPYYLRYGIEYPESGIMDHVIYYFSETDDPIRKRRLRDRVGQLTREQAEVLKEAIALFRDTTWKKVDEFQAQANESIRTIESLKR